MLSRKKNIIGENLNIVVARPTELSLSDSEAEKQIQLCVLLISESPLTQTSDTLILGGGQTKPLSNSYKSIVGKIFTQQSVKLFQHTGKGN